MRYWIYNAAGDVRGRTVYAEDAALMVAALGDGAFIVLDGRLSQVLWREGSETQSAAESYDYADEVMRERAKGELD